MKARIVDLDHHEHDQAHDHPPIGTVTAVLVGLVPYYDIQVKRWVDEYEEEALIAILPGLLDSALGAGRQC